MNADKNPQILKTMSYYRFSFGSSIGYCDELRSCIRALARIEGYGEQFSSNLELTLHEAFVNAVMHGNEGNPDLTVSVTLYAQESVAGSFLEARIRDSGRGFEAGSVPDPCSGDALHALHGRGLFLISHFTRSVSVEPVTEGSMLILHYIPF
jgi:anti-sigma regulatory factor (Ser/Thr protein kinase)